MKLQTRRRMFYALVLLFIVAGAGIVMYADGWRIDFATMQARKAGGIYVRSFPQNAAITLNGKPVQNQSGFLSPGTFISGLFPKSYALSLTASGYDAWTETLTVAPSLVTELKHAVLVPKDAIDAATSGPVTDFFVADGDIVARSASGTITWRDRAIARGMIVSHSTDLRTMIVRGANPRTGGVLYSLYDFTENTSTNLSAIIQTNGIAPTAALNAFIDPADDTGIIVQTRTKITRINAETGRATVIETAPAGETVEPPIAISPSTMAWARFNAASDTSQIVVYDTFSGNTIDNSLIVPGSVLQLAWVKNGELGVLEADNSLYLYDVQAEQLSKLADDVTQFYPTADGNAVAALERHSLEVFSFNPQEYYRFAPPQIADVRGLVWYADDAHLFVQYPNRVAFLDLTDAALKNLATVSATAPDTASQYDPQTDSLYLIGQNQELLRFDFPH